jgi:hypothetical protein
MQQLTNQQNEAVSMSYFPSVTATTNPKIIDRITQRYHESPYEDETLLVLDRLKVLTQQSMALQVKLFQKLLSFRLYFIYYFFAKIYY